MTNEPKASQGLDSELLAAYVDQRLSPEQRAAVEAQLANDPESYAVLVETMRTLDGLQAAPVVVPMPSRTRSSRTTRWVIAGGALAAAAAIVLAVWIPRRGFEGGGNAVEPRLQKLVAAVGNERYIEARVTGGFQYGPLRSVTRSGATANLAVVAAAGELQAAANANPNAENLRNWGSAALHVGQWDDAVRALERGASLDPVDARLQADLSAAYLARSQQLDRADDLPKGLAAAERALRLDDRLLEARFNRALALELLHLSSEAKKAWEDYAARDSSEWGALARERAARPIAGDPDEVWRAELSAVNTQTPLDALFARFPENAVRISEVEWTAQWAQAVNRDDEDAIAAAQRQLVAAGSALERVCSDRLISELARFLVSLNPRDRRDVASAIDHYHRGRIAFDAYSYADAATTLGGAVDQMRQQQNPLHVVAQLDHAAAMRASRQMAVASTLMPSLQAAAEPYPALAARAHRLSGLVNVGTGRYARALDDYRAAKEAFAAIGFRKSAGLANVLIAEVLTILGSRDTWRFHAEGLRLAEAGASPRDLQSITFTAGILALNEGLPEAASHFFASMVTSAEQMGAPGPIAEARLNRARALLAIGDSAAFETELRNAHAVLNTLPAGPVMDFLRGDWTSMQAEWLAKTHPEEAVNAAQVALEYARQKDRTSLIPRLHLALGRALVGLKRDEEAARAFQEGIAAFEALWRNVNQDTLRISHFDLTWDLYGELVAVQMRQGQPLLALATLERSQARSLLAARARPAVDWNLDQLQAAMAPSAAVVYMMPRSEVTYGWVVRSSGTQSFVIPVKLSEIEQAANESTASLTQVAQRLFAPIAPMVGDVTAIGLVAPGLLSQLPWATVELAPGRSLIDAASVQLLPSGSFLTLIRRSPLGSRALIVASSRRVRDGVTDLPELPSARGEAVAVAKLYEHATVRIDTDARADVVLNDLMSHDVFHFAGHAVANESMPHLSRLILADGDTISSAELATIASTRLRLAILTACSTATGAVVRSEGSVSLSWMLLAKGVDSVVATVRPVSDRSASKFGIAFHTSLRGGAPVAESLRRAQLELRSSEPAGERDWSYFVLVGGADQLLNGGW